MLPSLDKIFIFIAIVALPNLYFQAQYNVPLMLFCYAVWSNAYIPLIMYLLVLSWFVDCFRVFSQLSHGQHDQYQKKKMVFVLMICLFILKLICFVLLMILNTQCREALRPQNILDNFKHTFITPKRQE